MQTPHIWTRKLHPGLPPPSCCWQGLWVPRAGAGGSTGLSPRAPSFGTPEARLEVWHRRADHGRTRHRGRGWETVRLREGWGGHRGWEPSAPRHSRDPEQQQVLKRGREKVTAGTPDPAESYLHCAGPRQAQPPVGKVAWKAGGIKKTPQRDAPPRGQRVHAAPVSEVGKLDLGGKKTKYKVWQSGEPVWAGASPLLE